MVTLLWLDLETTGLNPKNCYVLEVAAVLPAGRRFERVLGLSEEARRSINSESSRLALDMHTKSGLLTKSAASLATKEQVDADLVAFLADVPGKLTLAGSSVHFDRGFIEEHFPLTAKRLQHRHLDVSVFLTSLDSLGAETPNFGEPQHTAMADIERSMKIFEFFSPKLLK